MCVRSSRGATPRSRDDLTVRCGGPLCAHDALLLIGHGSSRFPDAASALHRHADALRVERRFVQVEVALLNGAPSVADALGRIGAATIRVVPIFMEDGYFCRVAVPRAIAAAVTTGQGPGAAMVVEGTGGATRTGSGSMAGGAPVG